MTIEELATNIKTTLDSFENPKLISVSPKAFMLLKTSLGTSNATSIYGVRFELDSTLSDFNLEVF